MEARIRYSFQKYRGKGFSANTLPSDDVVDTVDRTYEVRIADTATFNPTTIRDPPAP